LQIKLIDNLKDANYDQYILLKQKIERVKKYNNIDLAKKIL